MRRLRLPVTRLLVLLLLAQWAAAFTQCFAALGNGAGARSVEICTADGLHTIVLGEDGRPAPELPVHHPTCPECGGPAALEPSPPPSVAVPVVWAHAAPARPSAGLPVAPPRAPPQQPRAPPLT